MPAALLTAIAVLALATIGGLLAWTAGGPSGKPLEPASPVRILVLVLAVTDIAGSLILALQGSTGGPLLVGSATVALGIGAWLGSRWSQSQLVPAGASSAPVRWVVVAAAGSVGAIALASIVAKAGIPLLSADPQGSRAAFTGLSLDAFRWLVPPASLAALGWALAAPSRTRLAIAAVAMGLVAGIEVLFASRALPFELGLGGGLIVWWSGHRPGTRAWVVVGVTAAALFLGVLFARMGPAATFHDPLDALDFATARAVGRVVLIQPRAIDVAVASIPSQEPFWAGATYLHRAGAILGIADDHPPLGNWLYARLYPGAPAAFAAPGLLAEGWVNAGAPLALALMLLLGLGAQRLGALLGRLGTGPADRAAAALVVVAIARTYATSLNGVLLTVAVTVAWWLAVRPGSVELVRRFLRRDSRRAPGGIDQAGRQGPDHRVVRGRSASG